LGCYSFSYVLLGRGGEREGRGGGRGRGGKGREGREGGKGGEGREGKRREGEAKGSEGKGREGKGREGKGREGKGKGREGKGREGKGREGKGREGKGREGKGERERHTHSGRNMGTAVLTHHERLREAPALASLPDPGRCLHRNQAAESRTQAALEQPSSRDMALPVRR